MFLARTLTLLTMYTRRFNVRGYIHKNGIFKIILMWCAGLPDYYFLFTFQSTIWYPGIIVSTFFPLETILDSIEIN